VVAAVEAASEAASEEAVSVDAVEPQAAKLMTIEAASTELTSFFICTFPPDMQAAVMGSHNPCRFID
jgi:hypothetical protein